MRHSLGGVAFEADTQAALRALGWEVRTTSTSGDFGADLIGCVGTETLVVQCKDYGSPVGLTAVQEVHYAKTHYHATSAAVVARNGFTKAAIQAAASAGVTLLLPAEITSGSPLDRTRSRFEYETQIRLAAAQKQQAEEKRQASAAWKDYDESVSKFRTVKRNRILFCKFLMALSVMFILIYIYTRRSPYDIDWRAIIVCETILVGFPLSIFLVSTRAAPDKPAFPRKSCIVECDLCQTQLRVEYGKVGQVRCPKCSYLMGVST